MSYFPIFNRYIANSDGAIIGHYQFFIEQYQLKIRIFLDKQIAIDDSYATEAFRTLHVLKILALEYSEAAYPNEYAEDRLLEFLESESESLVYDKSELEKIILVFMLAVSCIHLPAQPSNETAKPTFRPGAQLMTLVVHTFRTGNPQRYDLRLDPGGFAVVIPGIVLNGDWYFWKNKPLMHLRFAGGWYKDSGFNDAGFVHVALRRDFFKKPGKKCYVTAGIGPAFFMRDNWNRIYPGRVKDPFYGDRVSKNGVYQYRFFPIGGEVDLIWQLKKGRELDLSIIPGVPAAIIFKIGIRL